MIQLSRAANAANAANAAQAPAEQLDELTDPCLALNFLIHRRAEQIGISG